MRAAVNQQQLGKQIGRFVAGFGTGMLVTEDMLGLPRGLPMRIANHGHLNGCDDAVLRPPHLLTFVTQLNNPLLPLLEFDPKICVTLQDGVTFACLLGTASASDDPERIHQLSSSVPDSPFNGVADEANIALLDCRIDFADFWHAAGIESTRFLLKAGEILVIAADPERTTRGTPTGATLCHAASIRS